MQLSKHLALVAVALMAVIIKPVWPLVIPTSLIIALFAFMEYIHHLEKDHSKSIEKRLQALEETARTQSFAKTFK